MKDEAEKPSESAEKSDKAEATEKVKKEGAEASEREEESEDGGEVKAAQAGNTRFYAEVQLHVTGKQLEPLNAIYRF